jgi:hypothetical protein
MNSKLFWVAEMRVIGGIGNKNNHDSEDFVLLNAAATATACHAHLGLPLT